jgi:hypothetical protein
VLVDGIGTDTLTVTWWMAAGAYHACSQTPPPYVAFGDILPFLATLNVDIGGVPIGTTVTVSYAWKNRTRAKSRSEAGAEDDALVSGTRLAADGVDLFGAAGFAFDVVATRTIRGRDTGSFLETAGVPWDISVSGEPFALISSPGVGPGDVDRSLAFQSGCAVFRLGAVPPPLPECAPPALEFSVDIASDAELSDPAADGDEVFDPGDLYPAGGPFLPAPLSGFPDDALIFGGFDHEPDPLGPPGVPNAAPACLGDPPPEIAERWFDLDGSDRTDFDVRPLIDAGGPIAPFPSPCVFDARHLAFSYDDDLAGHHAGSGGPICDVPTRSPSPGIFGVYGSDATEDEVLAALVGSGATPVTLGPVYGVASERALHPNLAPGPDPAFEDDDDVDALDALPGPGADGEEPPPCEFWYFSADHEAVSFLGLDPGDIYLVVPGGPLALAVDDVVDLGLDDDTDLDAFEFAFHRDAEIGPALVVLFSVDDDDPLTPGDESGGLDPAMVYVSWMTGFSVPFLDAALDDDVDALTVYCEELTPPDETGACCFACAPTPAAPCPDPSGAVGPACVDVPEADCLASSGTYRGDGTACADAPFPCRCPGDVDGDGKTDVFDFAEVASSFGAGIPACATRAEGDVNCDGVVDVFDFADLAADFGCDSN